MYKLNKTDIKNLKPLVEYFLQVKEKYKRASTFKEDMLASEYYEKLTGKKENNFTCNQCIFKMYSTVGTAYWEALKALDTVADTDKKTKPTTKKTKTNDRRRTKTKKE